MGRDKENKKSTQEIVGTVLAVISAPIFYEIFVYFAALDKYGTAWDEMLNLNLTIPQAIEYVKVNYSVYFSLVFSRLIIYFVPGLFYFMIAYYMSDNVTNWKALLYRCYNLQFLGYVIYQVTSVLLALDFLIELHPLNHLGSYMTIFGYIATLYLNINSESRDEVIS